MCCNWVLRHFQDILANDDMKLDNIFIASLVFDIIKVKIETNYVIFYFSLDELNLFLLLAYILHTFQKIPGYVLLKMRTCSR